MVNIPNHWVKTSYEGKLPSPPIGTSLTGRRRGDKKKSSCKKPLLLQLKSFARRRTFSILRALLPGERRKGWSDKTSLMFYVLWNKSISRTGLPVITWTFEFWTDGGSSWWKWKILQIWVRSDNINRWHSDSPPPRSSWKNILGAYCFTEKIRSWSLMEFTLRFYRCHKLIW